MKRFSILFFLAVFSIFAGCSSTETSTVVNDPIIYAEGSAAADASTQKVYDGESVVLPDEDGIDVRYNEVRQKASHNAYQRDESIIDQLIYHRVRTIEYDLHTNYGEPVLKLQAAPDGDWLVYHHIADMKTNFKLFSQALSQLKGFHEIMPEHEVITVFFDIGFDAKHTPQDFDDLISSYISREWIFTPADLLNRCAGASTLKGSVNACGWPYLEELRGKFIFVPTSGSYAGENRKDALERLCFVTGGFGDVNSVFFNMEYEENDTDPAEVYNAGYVSRVYYADSAEKFADAKDQKANLIAINEINSIEYPWSNTFNSSGYPFECIDDPDRIPGDYKEKADIIGIVSDSGGLGIAFKDSFTFLYENAANEDSTWSGIISVPDSFSHSGANAFIMARESLSPGSPYFAVVRPSSVLPLSVLIRTRENCLPKLIPGLKVTPSGIPWHDAPFVRLNISNGCKTISASGSFDGRTWVEIASYTFSMPLNMHGIGTSSDLPGGFKSLFAGITKATSSDVKKYTSSDLITGEIGKVNNSAVFDGVFPE
jgi:hypothetical protein